MKTNQLILAICLGITLFATTSCNLSKHELKAIIRKEAGKDDFRDSEKWGKVVTKPLDLTEFTHINLKGNADVKFTQGDTWSVEALGNERAIEGNDIRVEDGTLVVSKKGDTDPKQPSIKLIITAPTIESITVSGAGDIDLKKTAELDNDLSITVSGAGDVELNEVSCKALRITISGAGDVTAKHIQCDTGSVIISGAGDLTSDITATDLTVSLGGAGDAELDVKCQTLTVIAGGTGEVELKGECETLTKRSAGLASIDSRKLTVKNLNIQ